MRALILLLVCSLIACQQEQVVSESAELYYVNIQTKVPEEPTTPITKVTYEFISPVKPKSVRDFQILESYGVVKRIWTNEYPDHPGVYGSGDPEKLNSEQAINEITSMENPVLSYGNATLATPLLKDDFPELHKKLTSTER